MENDEISLKELITILLSDWKSIVYTSLIVGVVVFLYTFLLVPRTYMASNDIMFNIPSTAGTKYGTYTFPSQSIVDYINPLTSRSVVQAVVDDLELEVDVDRLLKSIDVNYKADDEQKFITVSVSFSNAELAKEINDSLIYHYINTLQNTYKKEAISQFIYEKNTSIDAITFNLEKVESAISEKSNYFETMKSVYTLQKGLFGDPTSAALYADQFNLDLSKMSDDVVVEEYLNQNYLKLEAELVDLEITKIEYLESIKFNTQLLDELEDIKSNQIEVVDNDNLNILYGSIYTVQDAFVPTRPESRGTVLNTLIAGVLAGMVMVFYVFFKHYWLNSEK